MKNKRKYKETNRTDDGVGVQNEDEEGRIKRIEVG